MPTLDESFPGLRDALSERYGRSLGTISTEPFLAVAVAVLAGVPVPAKVIAARTALADADLIDAENLAATDIASVIEVLDGSAVPLPRKAVAALQRLARWFLERYEGSDDALRTASTEQLRDELNRVNGVGRATADSLLLHALGRPLYPVDRASYRVLVRHGWLDASSDYDEARAAVERALVDDIAASRDLSAGMERVGREFCRVAAPRCEHCPLRSFLPEGGVIEPEVG